MATAVATLGQTRRFVLPRATWLTLGLVFAVTIAPLASIHLVGWAPGTEVLFAVVISGALLAFCLSGTRLRTRWIIAIGGVMEYAINSVRDIKGAYIRQLNTARYILLYGDNPDETSGQGLLHIVRGLERQFERVQSIDQLLDSERAPAPAGQES